MNPLRIDEEEMSKAKDELNTEEDGDLILFGSPQLGLSELALSARSYRGTKI